MEDVNSRHRISFSFPELQYSLLELNSRKYCQHLTNWTTWNYRGKVWSNLTSLFEWRFRSRRCRCCSRSVPQNSSEKTHSKKKCNWHLYSLYWYIIYKRFGKVLSNLPENCQPEIVVILSYNRRLQRDVRYDPAAGGIFFKKNIGVFPIFIAIILSRFTRWRCIFLDLYSWEQHPKFWKRKMKSSSFVASRWVLFCTYD